MLEGNVLPATLFEEIEVEMFAIVKMCVNKNQNILAKKIFSKVSLILNEIKQQHEDLQETCNQVIHEKNNLKFKLDELQKKYERSG